MSRKLGLWILALVAVSCLVILGLSPSVGQDRKSYEVQTQVYGVTAGRSDAARAIDAYERLMERYMDQTQEKFAGLGANLDAIAHRLDALDAKLTVLDTRIARIEKHLGIKPIAPAPDPNVPAEPVPGAL